MERLAQVTVEHRAVEDVVGRGIEPSVDRGADELGSLLEAIGPLVGWTRAHRAEVAAARAAYDARDAVASP